MRRFLTAPAVILTVVSLVAGCTGSDDTADETTTTGPTTTLAAATTVAAPATATTVVATTEVVSSSDAVVASFDGVTCTYQGPERVSPTEPLTVSFTNESDEIAGLTIRNFERLDVEEIRALIGEDLDHDQLPEIPGAGFGAEFVGFDPGESMTQNVLLASGTWVVDCHTYELGEVGGPAHHWFVGVIESE